MARRKLYRIFCVTEDMNVEGYTNLDDPPDECPNNPAHTIIAASKAIIQTVTSEESRPLDNLVATTNPSASDDINSGYSVNSRWVNTSTGEKFVCTDNTSTAAVWILDTPSIALKEPSGFPNRTDSDISFVGGTTREFTISPTATNFTININGTRYTKTTENVTIDDTEGIWYIYYNSSGVLTASQTEWDFLTDVPVALLYWDATNNVALGLAEERHGEVMDSRTHKYLHNSVGTVYIPDSGLDIGNYTVTGDGSSNADAQMSFSDGTLYDEDIEIDIANAAVPTDPFEQILSTVAQIPVYYLNSNGLWRKDAVPCFRG